MRGDSYGGLMPRRKRIEFGDPVFVMSTVMRLA